MKNSFIVRIAGGAVIVGMVGLLALAGIAYATVPTFSQTSVIVGVNQSISISTQNSTSIYMGMNSTPTVASVSTNGTQATFTGIQPGTANVSLCNVGTASDCVTVYVTVQSGSVSTTATTTTTSNTSGLSFSLNNLSLAVGQSTTTIISGGNGAYGITGNSNSADISVGMSGGNGLIIDGMEPGSGTVTVCDSNNICGTVSVTIGAGSGSTSTSNSNQAISFNTANPTLTVGQPLNITLSGGTTFFVLSNPNPSIALASISGSTLTLTGESAGSDTLIISVAGGGYSQFPVTVTGTASASTATMPTTTSVPTVTAPVNTGTPSTVAVNATLLSEIRALQNAVSQALTQIESIQTQLNQLETQVNAGSTGSAAVSASGVTFNELLSVGSENTQVAALQARLAALGDYSGPITGFYGSLTASAVAKYQTAHGIETTGSVGPLTQTALNAAN